MNKFIIVLAIVLVVFSLTGCVTPTYHETDSELIQIDENNGIEVKCKFIDHETIVKKHGIKNNPFLEPPMSLTPKYFIIFELTIKNLEEAAIKLDIRDILYYYNNRKFKPMSKVQIEDVIDEFGTNGMDKSKKRRIAKANMLGDIRKIPGNSTVKGYLVFLSGFSDRGESELNIPFRTIDNLEAGDFTFYYDFLRK